MDINERKMVAKGLLSTLSSFPFPYKDILQKQIESASMVFDEGEYHFGIYFSVSSDVQPFPFWFPIKPLSWHVMIDEIPVACELYTSHGYVELLKVIDMSFEQLKWELILTSPCHFEQEYGEQHIIEILTDEMISVEKQLIVNDTVYWEVKAGNRTTTIIFDGCNIRKLDFVPGSAQISIRIDKRNITDNEYLIRSGDGMIDFNCMLMRIEHYTHIG